MGIRHRIRAAAKQGSRKRINQYRKHRPLKGADYGIQTAAVGTTPASALEMS